MTITVFTGLMTLVALAQANITVALSDIKVPTNLETVTETAMTAKPITLEEYVREYWEDSPIMAEVAMCESRFRQTGSDGTILRGRSNPADVGIMQVNEFYHAAKADELGHDLYALDGNLAYAKYLYERYGLRPWKASAPCWGKFMQTASAGDKPTSES